ncbi:MAG: PEGA domain-containing protein, partial [Polyangiales bacterium]
PTPRAPRPAPTTSRPAPSIAARPTPAPGQQAAEPAPAPAAEGGGTGTLRVQTRPWSNVLVDGRMVGTTPLMNVPVSAGRHTLTFVNDDFGIRKTVKVQIEAGQVLTQVLTLTE